MARLASIDYLRGIAALLVIFQHATEVFVNKLGVNGQGKFLADIAWDFDFGRVGVVCFFLISGFVIPYSLNYLSRTPLKKFLIRRVFRLYPIYWFSIFIIVLVQLAWSWPIEVNLASTIINMSMLQRLFGQEHFLGVYWTLQVELVFYLICAFLFYLKILHQQKFILFYIFVGVTIFALGQCYILFINSNINIHKEIQYLPFLLSIMFLGSLFRSYFENRNNSLLLYCFIGSVICFIMPFLLLILSLVGVNVLDNQFRFGVSHLIAFALFLIGCFVFSFKSNVLKVLGEISYSLYIFHTLIITLMVRLIDKFEINLFMGWHLAVYVTFSVLLTIIFSLMTYRFIELPSIMIGRNFTKIKPHGGNY